MQNRLVFKIECKFVLAFLIVTSICSLASAAPYAQPLAVKSARDQLAARPAPVASYQIQVTLDPAAKTLRGHETLTYLNTSRDALRELPFHLYLNAFRDMTTTFMRDGGGALRSDQFDPQHPGWIEVDAARLAGGADLLERAQYIADRTVMTLTLPAPLQPGASVQIEFDFHAQLPKVFARTGFWGEDFFMVGQWFPKIARYDEQGWHAWPFHGNAEFYADFGAYDVDITVPRQYVVGATGVPVRAAPVRTQTQGDLKTVSYHAEDVIDFAWTASPRFKTITRRAGEVEIVLLYQPENEKYAERYLKATAQSLEAYGQWYAPYPYPRITVMDPPAGASGAGGMEYPMFITAGVGALGLPELPVGTLREAEIVVLHEMGHQWFYATVATNEAEEPWLDEGFTDFSTVEAATRYYGLNTSMIDAPGLQLGYRDMRRLEYLAFPRVSTYGKSWEFGSIEYGIAAYSKPISVLYTLKGILGAETFERVMKTYVERYRFRHPRTEDFIAVAQEVSGRDLKWFFDQAVYGKGVLDYAVDAASTRAASTRAASTRAAHPQAADGKYVSTVRLARLGEVKFPVDVRMTFGDGSTKWTVWDGQAESQTLSFDTPAPLVSVALDPERKLALDVDMVNNSLMLQTQTSPLLRLGSRWLFWMQLISDFGF